MPVSDYAHWNEDAERVWWEEEGSWRDEPVEPNDDDEYLSSYYDDETTEHLSADDCRRDGNFDLPSRTGIWECSECGRAHPEFVTPMEQA